MLSIFGDNAAGKRCCVRRVALALLGLIASPLVTEAVLPETVLF
jgi:hypothetical protein